MARRTTADPWRRRLVQQADAGSIIRWRVESRVTAPVSAANPGLDARRAGGGGGGLFSVLQVQVFRSRRGDQGDGGGGRRRRGRRRVGRAGGGAAEGRGGSGSGTCAVCVRARACVCLISVGTVASITPADQAKTPSFQSCGQQNFFFFMFGGLCEGSAKGGVRVYVCFFKNEHRPRSDQMTSEKACASVFLTSVDRSIAEADGRTKARQP